eukprot:scaffold4056_cov115-Cylindrotheca_fusiformis.AAC.7
MALKRDVISTQNVSEVDTTKYNENSEAKTKQSSSRTYGKVDQHVVKGSAYYSKNVYTSGPVPVHCHL